MLMMGLSERWFMKEAGDLHWEMVCADLGVQSRDLADQAGARLYASFLRVCWESNTPLSSFRENDELHCQAWLSRFGDKRFFSDVIIDAEERRIHCQLASVFVTRETTNRSLARAAPAQLLASRGEVHEVMPPFAQGYQRVKAVALEGQAPPSPLITLAGTPFEWQPQPEWQTHYAVNPYYDLNGVNLLYFASYPRIHDVCERECLRTHGAADRDWAQTVSTVARDVYYYGNAEAGEQLRFDMSSRAQSGSRLAVTSSLTRAGDGCRIADIFTVKHLIDAAPR